MVSEVWRRVVAYILFIGIVLYLLWKYTVWNWPYANANEILEKIQKENNDADIELRLHAYEDVVEGCTWDGELIVNGKEYDIDVLYDLLKDEVIKKRIVELLEGRDGDGSG